MRIKILMIMPGNGLTEKRKFSAIFSERQINSLSKLGIKINRVYVGRGISLNHILKPISNLLRKRKENTPDIIHAQYGSMTSFLGVLIHNRIPLIISFCGSDLLGSYRPSGKKSIKGNIAIKLSKLSARYASGIIVKSEELMEVLPTRYKSKTRIIPTGVDLKLFYPMSRGKARNELGLPINRKVVLFNTGNGSSVKNPELAKSTFKLIQRKRKDAELFLIRNESPDKIPLIMNAADVLLLTSYHEGSPNIVKEALACNLPVVSVPCGDIRERLNEVYPSFVVDPSAENLAEALDKVLELDQRSNGREKIQDLSLEKVGERMKKFYCQILKEK